MSIWHALVLGIVQGLTEFLPISSSGHLAIVPWLFGWNDFANPQTAKAFDTALHLGTLVAVLIYLRKDVLVYIAAGTQLITQRKDTKIGRRAWLVLLSAVPAGSVGIVLGDAITDKLGSSTSIALSLIFFGLILVWADRRGDSESNLRSIETLNLRDTVVIGLAQVLALNPGTSRSGITITAARLSGFGRDASARLSFLISVPVISGAVVFELAKLAQAGIPQGLLIPMIVGIVTAGAAGFIAMSSMIRFLQSKTFVPYVVYRCLLGVGILLLVAARM